MHPENTPASHYLLMSFAVTADLMEEPPKMMASCGRFESVEDAFEHAREIAESQWRRMAEEAANDEKRANCELVATEHGYDIRMDSKLVQRFWIHDRCALQALAI